MRERMELALKRTNSLIFRMNLKTGKIQRYGPYEQFFDIPEDENITYKNYLENIVHEEDKEKFRNFYERIKDGDIESGEIEYCTKPETGKVQWIRDIVHTEDDTLIGIAHDITDYIEHRKELRHHHERFEELASVVSHDLETPIEIVRGHLELAKDSGETEYVKKAMNALNRVDELREDLVNVLRTQDIVEETEPVNIENVAKSIWDRFNPSDESRLKIEEKIKVNGDPDAIERMLENLVSNCIEHTENEVKIRIGGFDSGFYIEDDGPGISEEIQPEIFTPGFSTKDKEAIGMGMASVRQIIQAHDWQINIDDAKNLEGARFEIYTE